MSWRNPESLAAVVTGTSGSASAVLDGLFTRVLDVVIFAWEKAGILSGDEEVLLQNELA